MRKRHKPEQIVSMLCDIQSDLNAGLSVDQALRKAGIGITTFYRWKAQQQAPVSVESLRLRELENQVDRLEHLVAELALDRRMLQEALKKKAMTAPRRRQIVTELGGRFASSERRVCRALGLHRSGVRSVGIVGDEQRALVGRIEKLAGLHPRFGYRRIWVLLRREGWAVNKKTVHRLWKLSGLKLSGPRAKTKKRFPHGQDKNGCHLEPSRGKDDVWTWDFIFDRTSDGRSLKWLSLIDEYTRECLSLEARRSMTALEIREILADVVARRGSAPLRVRSDNGPEFAAEAVRDWLAESGSRTLYVAPGSPWQNGFAESFHSRLRDEFLEREEFENPKQAQALSDLWKEDYNTERPHSSLNYESPAAYAAKHERYVPIDATQPMEPVSEQTYRGLP